MAENRIPWIITKLYALVDELQELFPERKFTPDGHLVGSIGEVVAKYFYNLSLTTHSSNHDAMTLEDPPRTVQIKLTANTNVAIAVQANDPDILIVLHIDRRLGFKEIYNGPFPTQLLSSKKPTKRLVKSVSFHQLKVHQRVRSLSDEGRIMELNSFFRESSR